MITRDLLPLAKPISMFTPDPANARKHDERSYEVVANSLRQFGQRKPIVAQEKGGQFIVRAGNGTLEAAKRLGWTEIAAVIVNEDSVTSTAYAIADNKTAEVSTWDDEVLNKTLKALADEGVHVEDFGFTAEQVGVFDIDFAAAPELPEGDRKETRQITFVLHETQALIVEQAIEIAKSMNLPKDINENSNGNAITYVCERFMEWHQPKKLS